MADRGLLDLIINRIPGLTVPERLILCGKFDREDEISILSKEDIEGIIERPLKPWTMDEVRFQAEGDERAARFRGIGWVSWVMGGYPPQLREMYDSPAVLFFRGTLPDPEKPLIAVVGTRRPSPAGAAQAYEMGRELGAAGLPVVSGLALGIDALAHRGNLDGGAPTFAVLGSGADEIYPLGNRLLAKRILEKGGALLSEYPPGTGPRPWHFPARNRIISGLARGTVVMEAPEKSGALITARCALDQNRDLWVAAGGTGSPHGAGAAKLAEEGAGVIRRAAEVLDEWNWPMPAPPGGLPAAGGESLSPGRGLAASLAQSLQIDL
jgi:DNA processing protein